MRKADIPEAMLRLGKELPSASPACFLVCEELLMHLLRNGDREIRLSLREKRRSYVEIRAAGCPDHSL